MENMVCRQLADEIDNEVFDKFALEGLKIVYSENTPQGIIDFHKSTVTEEYRAAYNDGRLYFLIRNKHPVGILRFEEVQEGIYEIGRSVMLPQFRGQGHYSAFRQKAVEDFRSQHPKAVIITATSKDPVKRIVHRDGWKEIGHDTYLRLHGLEPNEIDEIYRNRWNSGCSSFALAPEGNANLLIDDGKNPYEVESDRRFSRVLRVLLARMRKKLESKAKKQQAKVETEFKDNDNINISSVINKANGDRATTLETELKKPGKKIVILLNGIVNPQDIVQVSPTIEFLGMKALRAMHKVCKAVGRTLGSTIPEDNIPGYQISTIKAVKERFFNEEAVQVVIVRNASKRDFIDTVELGGEDTVLIVGGMVAVARLR